MSDALLVALAAAGGGVIVALINAIFGRKNARTKELKALCAAMEINQDGLKLKLEEMRAEQREFRAVTLLRLEQLDKKQDKHNGFMERLAITEQSTKSAHHRIDEVRAGK